MKNIFYSILFVIPLLFVGCADAGKDQVVDSSSNVILDGSSSTTEVNGKITKYKWKQIKGKRVKLQNKKNVKASFIAPSVLEDTKLIFELITVEKGGYISPLKTSDTIEIIVQPQKANNNPPIPDIKTSANEIKLNQSINFDASASSDTDGQIVSYEWTNSNGEIISSDKVFDYTFTSEGKHTITLKITDDDGLSASSSVEIVVNELIEPVAKITVSSDTINIGESVTFDASTSLDEDGDIVTYYWKDANSEIISYEKTFTQTFDTKGQYPITLTVEDDDGLTHSSEVIITVQAVLTSIELSPTSINLEVGETSSITATGNYNDNTSLDITSNTPWTISDESVISIDESGTITALKAGTATIKTTIEDIESDIVTVEVNEQAILQSIVVSPNPITLRVNNNKNITIKGVYNDGSIKDIEESITYEIADTSIVSFDGVDSLTGLEKGETTLKIIVENISSSLIPIEVNNEIITTNFNFTNFGTKYLKQIPANATLEKYDEKLFAMITGTIFDEDGNPIEGVMVSIHDHDDYGSVITNFEGKYFIPAEGGGYLTVRYEKTGYTTIDRKVYAYPEDWAIADDVTMLKIDEKVTTINLNSSTPQTHSSTVVTDDRGSRATTLVFDGVGSATVKSKDGTTRRILDSIDVRATEFKTPESMPSDLPIETAYTYCTDITVDGVKDDETIEFNSSIIMYVDNFLGFEVGEIVPVGYYDRNKGKWVGSKNGVVIQLLDSDGDGNIDSLDATGDGIADDIDGDGTITSEVKGIEDNPAFQVGMTLWRSEITHFTPYDCNWPYAPDPDVRQPDMDDVNTDENEDDCSESINSYVETKKRVFHEDIKVSGTNLTLHYSSKRVDGYRNKLFTISGLSLPHDTATKASVSLSIGGKKIEKELDLSDFNNKATLEWDGKDILGNFISGNLRAKIEYNIDYKAFYQKSSEDFELSWAQTGITRATEIQSRNEIGLTSRSIISINAENPVNTEKNENNSMIAKGWSLSNHNFASKDIIYKGDGTSVFNDGIEVNKISSIRDGGDGFLSYAFIIDENDNIYASGYRYTNDSRYDYGELNKIIKIDSSGNITTLLGEGDNEVADGALSTEVLVNSKIRALAIDKNKNIYFPYKYRIYKIDEEGKISIVVGTGEKGDSGDKGLAKDAKIGFVRCLDFDDNGNMYILSEDKIRRVDTGGVITTVAGNGEYASSEDGGLATEVSLKASYFDIDSHGNIYIAEATLHRIRKVDIITGIITTIAGTGESGFSGDGGYATLAKLKEPNRIAINIYDEIYITDSKNNRIRKINNKGVISTIAGGGHSMLIEDGMDALDFYVGYYFPGINIDKYNELNLYRHDNKFYKIKKKSMLTNLRVNDDERLFINDDNTGDVYTLNGKHLHKIDLYNGKILEIFNYDDNLRLVKIVDQFGNEITITRDVEGNPTLITAPNGQKTYLSIDSKGDLTNISYEDNSQYQFEYIDGSLLSKVTHPNSFSSINIFDNYGRVLKEIDVNNEEWEFGKSFEQLYVEYYFKKPEGDLTFYREYNLDNGYTKSETINSSGDTATTSSSGDQKEVESVTNEIVVINSYKTDIQTNRGVLESTKTIKPSGLTQITTYATEYTENDEGVTISKTQTIASNGKLLSIVNNYENGITTITSPEGIVSKEEYDINTRLTSKTTSGTQTPTTYTYDSKGRIETVTTGTRTTTYAYNLRGNISSLTDARGKITSYEYDVLDRVTKVTHPNGAIEEYQYDTSGNMTKLITPVSTNHNFTYDNLDQRKSMNSPLNKLTSYTYNGNRKLTKIERPSGKTVVNTYTNDRLSSITTPEATTSYEYIFGEQIGSITKDTEKIVFSYDGDLLTSLAYNGVLNQTLSYAYNNDFLPTSFTYAGITDNYTYDNDGLLLTSGEYTLTRDANNGYATKVTDGALIQNLTYDNYGELVSVANNSFTYEITSKDNSALILEKKETINGTTVTYNYSYDDNARLIEVKKDNSVVESYSYDNNGNRTSAIVNGITTSATYTLDDQLEVYGNNTYRYDDDGYLLEKTTPDGVTTYTYSTLGELKEVKTPTQIITYKHNASNQRVSKLINGVVVEKYLWADLTTLLAVYDKDDNLIQRFTYASGRMPISMTQGSSKYYLHYDQVGSLRAVTDNNHNIVKEVIYDSFGNILSDSNESFSVPFGFAGGLLDRDTGLTRFGYRDYDSFTGKWTAKDPIDFRGGDTNLYGYVLNDPINFTDREGLWAPLVGALIGIVYEIYNNGWSLDGIAFAGLNGALGGIGKTMLKNILAGIISSMLNNIREQSKCGEFSYKKLSISAVLGALSAYISRGLSPYHDGDGYSNSTQIIGSIVGGSISN